MNVSHGRGTGPPYTRKRMRTAIDRPQWTMGVLVVCSWCARPPLTQPDPPDTIGRRLVAEVPARPGRRAFVDITPEADDRDARASHDGWQRPHPNRSFRVERWDYAEQKISGCDYDIGAVRVRTGAAANEAALLKLIAAWDLRPLDFTYPWNTADPR